MNKKVRISLLVGLALLISFTSFKATQAYLTYQKNVKNTFTVGYNTIEVEEDYDPPEEITTGETHFKKTIKVKNTGTVPCYVRVRMEYSDSDMKKFCSNILGTETVSADVFPNDIERLSNGKWIYSEEDVCYYYTEPLNPNESTVNLLDSVMISIGEDQKNQIKDFDIYVYAESIQTKINKDAGNGEIVAVEASGYAQAWNQMLGRGEDV